MKFDIQLSEVNKMEFDSVRDKMDRVVKTKANNEECHGRSVYRDKKNKLYYKVFNKDFVRRQNFIDALKVGFYDRLSPALVGIIYDGDDIMGYVTTAGEIADFKRAKKEMMKIMVEVIKETNFFYFDFVEANIIVLEDGQMSLVDLESVLGINKLQLKGDKIIYPDPIGPKVNDQQADIIRGILKERSKSTARS